jgi:hypothetical protein
MFGAEPFSRRLSADKLTIESRCNFCGAVIICKASDGLAQKEDDHIDRCEGQQIAG